MDNAETRLDWFVQVSCLCRYMTKLALAAFRDALEQKRSTADKLIRIELKKQYNNLQALLDNKFAFPNNQALAQHIEYCEINDLWDIGFSDVPAIVTLAERFSQDNNSCWYLNSSK